MSLARSLWEGNADLAAAALAHPFVRGLSDGSLPRESFAAYVAQDAYFLEAFARAYAFAVAYSPDRVALEAFADLLSGVRDELRLHDSYAVRWGIDLSTVEPAATTLAYTEFLLVVASTGGLGVTCAAMAPCMRLYAHLGQSLSGRAADPYAEWVSTYADPGFEALAVTLEGLLDTHAGDTAVVHEAYGRAMRLELAFFDTAFGRI